MLTPPIADLHCDLLMALAAGKAYDDPAIRCAAPQLRSGQVRWQTLAIFVEEGAQAVEEAEKQVGYYENLKRKQPGEFRFGWTHLHFEPNKKPTDTQVLPAIENASGFSHPGEPLDQTFQRLESWMERIGPPLYVSLTWKHENRFGGGNETAIGLKPDGEELIAFLKEKRIPVDLSHASDQMAESIISRDNIILASHSNFREVCNHNRNLPNEIAQEVIRRKGVIGLNAVRRFVGEKASDLARHIEHGLSLGADDALAFGADFFWEEGLEGDNYFFDDLGNSSCYPGLIKQLRREGITNDSLLNALCYRNAHHFVKQNYAPAFAPRF